MKARGSGYRVDSGEYRLGYEVDDDEWAVTILLVGEGGDDAIYEHLRRRYG